MNKPLMEAMTTSISEVLETMFYLSIEIYDLSKLENTEILEEEKITGCKLLFKGPLSGHILLYAPKSLLVIMAENFMGLNKNEITQTYTNGIICEINNMVAGSIFTKYNGRQIYNLGIPEILPENKIPTNLFENNEGVLVTETTDGFLVFKLVLQ